jgi:hypothetical protein
VSHKYSRRSFLNKGVILGGSALTFPFLRGIAASDQRPQVNRPAIGEAIGRLRPFYIIGHDPDRIQDVKSYLSEGANAIEPDVNVYKSRPNELCIDHGPEISVGPSPDDSPSLVQYLTDLRGVAEKYPQLALVYFDCKQLVATAQHGVTLINAIRTHLVGSGKDRLDLNVIISVATLAEKGIFEEIKSGLRAREGLMIDFENDPVAVSATLGASNQCFSNGISVENSAACLFAPHIRPSIARACELRAKAGKIRFVATWTVNDVGLMTQFIRIGVDGIIVDRSPPFYNRGIGLSGLVDLVRRQGARLGIRNATRQDNPFAVSN